MALAGVVVLAAVLRTVVAHQALYGDEIFTHDEVAHRSFGWMWHRVQVVEDSPPLFTAVTWVAARVFGAAGLALRAVSIVAAAATVPLLCGIGRRLGGRAAGLLGATVFAVSPFAVYYGSEARAYSLMAFLLVLSTYALVRAVESGTWRWWGAFAAANAAALYTHYTAGAVIAAQACWLLAARPRQWRVGVAAAASSAAVFAPWLLFAPSPTLAGFQVLFPFGADWAAKALAHLAIGHPFVPLRTLPGTLGFALLAVAAVATAAGLALARRAPRVSSGWALIGLLALAAPAGAAAYSLIATSVFASRNLYASLPFAALAAGAVVAAGRMRAVAAVALVAALLVTAVRIDQPSNRRPQFDEGAQALDRVPGRVVVLNLFPVRDQFGRHPLLDSLTIQMADPRRAVEVARGDVKSYDRAMRGALVHVVEEPPGVAVGDPPPPPVPPGYRELRRRVFPGFSRIALYDFVRSAPS